MNTLFNTLYFEQISGFRKISKNFLEKLLLSPRKSYIIPGNEKMALCDSQYSKISPLSGGEIIFATLGNRPSNEHFENSKVLQVIFFIIIICTDKSAFAKVINKVTVNHGRLRPNPLIDNSCLMAGTTTNTITNARNIIVHDFFTLSDVL